MSEPGPLHPDRIRQALRDFTQTRPVSPEAIVQNVQTAVAALELIRKCQMMAGLTPELVNTGAGLLQLFESVKALGPMSVKGKRR